MNIKSEKGITLTAVIVYVTSMVVVVAIMAVITSYFYNNVNKIGENVDPSGEYVKFASYFTEDTNKTNNKILECDNTFIAFENGEQYSFLNNSIYRNKIKICELVDTVEFKHYVSNEKEAVEVKIKMQDQNEKTVEYILN